MSNFKQLLYASLKSEDTEEWLDVHFTRPVGLVFALMWKRLGVHPNVVTLLSIVLGIGAAVMFRHTGLGYNLAGVCLLMLANFCDSTDGQLARLTGKQSFMGRVLDGFAGDVWFFCIYAALCLRLQDQPVPFTSVNWGVAIWLLAAVAGLLCHSRQSSLADYYRQIHLFFLNRKEGSELDSYRQQRQLYEQTPRRQWVARAFYYNYANYCHSQERRTPAFQLFYHRYQTAGEGERKSLLTRRFIDGSRPLMGYANVLTFNTRAIVLYLTCLLNCPWVYLLFEVTVMQLLYRHMRGRHEQLSVALTPMTDEGMGV